MRADLAAALLHDPALLFLDEPTIGLDVVARERIRGFLGQINRERGVTVILTTHDLADVGRLCQRVVLIDHGRVIYDGGLEQLRARYGRWRTLVVDFETPPEHLALPGAELIRQEANRAWLRVDANVGVASVVSILFREHRVLDLAVQEPEIEEVVRRIYEGRLLDRPAEPD